MRWSGVGGGGETNTFVGVVEDAVETLEECVTVDEVETLARVRSEVTDNEVDAGVGSTDVAVERTRPDLGVGGQGVGYRANLEVKVREYAVLSRGDLQETCRSYLVSILALRGA